MQVIRFDPEVGIPIRAHGSTFRIAPLATAEAARLQIIHLEAGGRIGRHPATGRQLLAVLCGDATATGGDGRTRSLSAGFGVIWEAGEVHDVVSPTGAVALMVEGSFDPTAFAVTKEIAVVDYDPAWAEWFERIHEFVAPVVADHALRVEHVGSTSVPGLAAKPVIDLDVVVATADAVGPTIAALAALGYEWRGDYGIPGREAFVAPAGTGLAVHHLYLVVDATKPYLDHVLLRDEMRADPELRRRYAELKRTNATAADSDINWYTAAKAAFVAEVLTSARARRGLPPEEYWAPDLR